MTRIRLRLGHRGYRKIREHGGTAVADNWSEAVASFLATRGPTLVTLASFPLYPPWHERHPDAWRCACVEVDADVLAPLADLVTWDTLGHRQDAGDVVRLSAPVPLEHCTLEWALYALLEAS